MKQALIIIDVQEAFFSDKTNPIFNENMLIENINNLIEIFRKRNELIIFVRHTEAEELKKESMKWQVCSKLNFKLEDNFINKATPDSFLDTDLMDILNKNKVFSIVITGLQTDYCIDSTCKSTFGRKIETVLVSDAHSTYNNAFMKANKIIAYHNQIIGKWFATLQETDAIIEKKTYKGSPKTRLKVL